MLIDAGFAYGSIGFQSEGIITLHGTDHDLLRTFIEFAGDPWKGTPSLTSPYTKWSIKDPSNFLLKVKPVVNVELELAGTKANSQ